MVALGPVFRRVSRYCIFFVMMVSLAVFAGWATGNVALKRVISSSVSMNPLTALDFLMSAAAFYLITGGMPSMRRAGFVAAGFVCFTGLTRMAELIFALDTGISRMMFAEDVALDIVQGRSNTMAPNTAFSFFMIGLSFFFYPFREGWKRFISDYFATVAMLVCFLSLIGFAYGAIEFYNLRSYIPMAFPTAVCFFLISLSIMLSRSEHGLLCVFTSPYQGSRIACALLPFAVVIPIASAYLWFYGVEVDLYSTKFGVSLSAMTNVIIFVILIWTTALSLNRTGRKLEQESAKARRLHEQLLEEQKKSYEKQLMQTKITQQRILIQAGIDGQEKERKQIGMELHDHINQILASAKLYLEIAREDQEADRDLIIDKGYERVVYAINEIRNLSRALVLHNREPGGIRRQLHELMDFLGTSSGLCFNVRLDETIFESLDENQQTALYRIVQEQLNNILKHADARDVSVAIWGEGGDVCLEIADNGKGFDVDGRHYGIGLSNIRSRSEFLNGTTEILSTPGVGTRLAVRFPCIT